MGRKVVSRVGRLRQLLKLSAAGFLIMNLLLVYEFMNKGQPIDPLFTTRLTKCGTINASEVCPVCDVKPYDCWLNKERKISCQRNETSNIVFVPFSFISKFYEAYGSHGLDSAGEHVFKYDHSFGSLMLPKEPYNPLGIHADDYYYYVEGRGRVLYVSGTEGVPVCISSWDKSGYFYPVNVGQYGLAHYSRYSYWHDTQRTFLNLDIGGSSEDKWRLSSMDSYVSQETDDQFNISVLSFSAPVSLDQPGVVLDLHPSNKQTFELIVHMRYFTFGSISAIVETKHGKLYTVHYIMDENARPVLRPYLQGEEVFYYVGLRRSWNRFTRDINLDLHKALLLQTPELNLNSMRIKEKEKILKNVRSIILRGSGYIKNMTLSNSAHLEHFLDTAEWMVKNIDAQGGWPIKSPRVMGQASLKPGWISALGQGCGISLMVRAYGFTKETRYLNAALRALKTFQTPSSEGGVKAVFMNQYTWYEEYPTVPASFVLNGFITSLFGLYDVAKVAPSPYSIDAQKLFDDGMRSLKHLLPYFDTGSRTVYDLKHITMPGLPPNVARWDYHNLHVVLLMYIYSIDNDPLFKTMIDRWDGYRKGKIVKTN